MTAYAWVIDVDHLADTDTNYHATTGPRNAPQPLLDSLTAGKGQAFRMYDDDNELYYSGRVMFACTCDPRYLSQDTWPAEDPAGHGATGQDCPVHGGALPDEAFGPLDDFGTPNAGCTSIRYRTDNRWEQL